MCKIAGRSILCNRRRSMLTVAATAFGLASFVFLLSFIDGYLSQIVANSTGYLTGELQIQHPDFRRDMNAQTVLRAAGPLLEHIERDPRVTNTLALTAELYYNGDGAPDPLHHDFPALFAGRINSVARRYAGLHAAYAITPLLKLNAHLVHNLDDGSHFIAPSLAYSLRADLDLSAGIKLARGRRGSEFAQFRTVLYVQLQRYF